MAEEVLQTIENNDITEERGENPYFAIEESVYGEKSIRRKKRFKKTLIKIGVLSSLTLAAICLVITDAVFNIRKESSLADGTLVNGMTYRQLIESINKNDSKESKTWIDFDNPYLVGNGNQVDTTINDKVITIDNTDGSHSYLLVNPSSQAIYQSDLAFDGNQYDFSKHQAIAAGDYILCAFSNRYTIPYRPVVDTYFYDKLGSGDYRRASTEDKSIQQDDNIYVIQDPTLLSLVVIRVA